MGIAAAFSTPYTGKDDVTTSRIRFEREFESTWPAEPESTCWPSINSPLGTLKEKKWRENVTATALVYAINTSTCTKNRCGYLEGAFFRCASVRLLLPSVLSLALFMYRFSSSFNSVCHILWKLRGARPFFSFFFDFFFSLSTDARMRMPCLSYPIRQYDEHVCVLHITDESVLCTRRHPAQPVSVPILQPY